MRTDAAPGCVVHAVALQIGDLPCCTRVARAARGAILPKRLVGDHVPEEDVRRLASASSLHARRAFPSEPRTPWARARGAADGEPGDGDAPGDDEHEDDSAPGETEPRQPRAPGRSDAGRKPANIAAKTSPTANHADRGARPISIHTAPNTTDATSRAMLVTVTTSERPVSANLGRQAERSREPRGRRPWPRSTHRRRRSRRRMPRRPSPGIMSAA